MVSILVMLTSCCCYNFEGSNINESKLDGVELNSGRLDFHGVRKKREKIL